MAPATAHLNLIRWLSKSRRRWSSFFATMCAPLVGSHLFMTLIRNSSDSRFADSGVSFEYIGKLWRQWARETASFHEHAIAHPEDLNDYGRMVHFELPALVDRMEAALSAHIERGG